jgi:hypothetical protein
VRWGKVDFVIMPGENPDSDAARVAGTLGLNFLRNFDLEVDSAKKKLKFFLPNKCDEMGPYWSDEFVSFPIALREGALPIAKAQLDNEDIRVILDTGSSVSWLSLDVARRHFALTPASPGVIKRGEIVMPSGKKVTTYAYTFGALTLSGIRFENVPIELGDFDHAELVLGMHELRHLRLYFAFKSGVVYATAADAGQSP